MSDIVYYVHVQVRRPATPLVYPVGPTTIQEAAARLVCTSQAWRWARNSCHVDTMLLVELAAYTYRPERATLNSSLCVRMLLSVLAAVNEDTQGGRRDAWHAYVSYYSGGRLRCGDTEDVVDHWRLVNTSLPFAPHGDSSAVQRNVESDRCIYIVTTKERIGCGTTCTVPAYTTMAIPTLVVSTSWQRRASRTGQVQRVEISTLQEAIERKLFQQCGTQNICAKCQKGYMQRITAVTLPTQLVVEFPAEGSNLPTWNVPESLMINQNKYALAGLAIRVNQAHYVARVQFGNVWYTYDDLRGGTVARSSHRESHDATGSGRTIRAVVYVRADNLPLHTEIPRFKEYDYEGDYAFC